MPILGDGQLQRGSFETLLWERLVHQLTTTACALLHTAPPLLFSPMHDDFCFLFCHAAKEQSFSLFSSVKGLSGA